MALLRFLHGIQPVSRRKKKKKHTHTVHQTIILPFETF